MKYNNDMPDKVRAFTELLSAEPESRFWKHCSVHHLACYLGCCRDSIYEWSKIYPEFSDTIKKWEEKRNACFLELKNKGAHWIFLAKNWLEMTDKQQVEHQGNEFKPLQIIITKNGNEPDNPA